MTKTTTITSENASYGRLSGIVLLIWPFECLILMILTMTDYHENLFLLSIARIFPSLETKMILKIPNDTFFRETRYMYPLHSVEKNSKIVFVRDSVRRLPQNSGAVKARVY